jgi:uncharacterized phage protein (TIGR02218 family)
MRTIPTDLAAHLEEDATTLCHAWRLTRTDGAELGFTDHDHDLAFAATTFRAASGFAASDCESLTGLSAPTGDVEGALSSEAITEADIIAGRFDGARVELFAVNWQAPEQHLRLSVFEIGEISRNSSHFTAELRTLAHRLDQTKGRIYAHRCDAAFGDGRCGIDAAGLFTVSGAVATVESTERITASGLEGFASGWFRLGRLTFASGANEGVGVDIASHARDGTTVSLGFWLPLAVSPAPGDTFTIVAGCDKCFSTCRDRFGNAINFRGFPHMPGSDFAYSYADGDTEHDGGPLYD